MPLFSGLSWGMSTVILLSKSNINPIFERLFHYSETQKHK